MKALAAVSIRQYERAVESLVEYARAVEMGFQILLQNTSGGLAALPQDGDGGFGAIVFGSDQGMVGQFNDVIANHAVNEVNRLQDGHDRCQWMAVGQRVLSRLEEAGQSVQEWAPVPGSTAAITPAVQDMVLKLEAWQSQGISQIVLFHNKPRSGASYDPHSVFLLPVDSAWFDDLAKRPWPCRSLPQFTMDSAQLFSRLIREFLFIALFRAFAESLASENASRLAAMQVAERNIKERIEALNGQFHQLRQSSIDAELFDLIAGFEALTPQT